MPTTATSVQVMRLDADDFDHSLDPNGHHHVTVESRNTRLVLNFADADEVGAILRIAARLASFVAEPDAAVSKLCSDARQALAEDDLIAVKNAVDAIEALTAHRAVQVPA